MDFDKAFESLKLVREFKKRNFGGIFLRIAFIHVENAEFAEIARDNPARLTRILQFIVITLSLKKNCLVIEIYGRIFLFDKDFGRFDKRIDESVRNLDFKADKLFGFDDFKDITQQREPKRLRLALFVAVSRPFLNESLDIHEKSPLDVDYNKNSA